MIYSSASFLNENFDWKKLKNCKVWVASYSDTRPKLPVSADLWQYTKKGSLEGANTDKGYCDLVYSYMEATSIKFTKPTLTMKKYDRAGNGQNKTEWLHGSQIFYVFQPKGCCGQ